MSPGAAFFVDSLGLGLDVGSPLESAPRKQKQGIRENENNRNWQYSAVYQHYWGQIDLIFQRSLQGLSPKTGSKRRSGDNLPVFLGWRQIISGTLLCSWTPDCRTAEKQWAPAALRRLQGGREWMLWELLAHVQIWAAKHYDRWCVLGLGEQSHTGSIISPGDAAKAVLCCGAVNHLMGSLGHRWFVNREQGWSYYARKTESFSSVIASITGKVNGSSTMGWWECHISQLQNSLMWFQCTHTSLCTMK